MPLHSGRPLRVLVADGDALARRALREAVGHRCGLTVEGEAGDTDELIRSASEGWPDLTLVDAQLPEAGGLVALRRLLREQPQALVVVQASRVQEDVALLTLRAGAVGYLPKDLSPMALARHLRGVAVRGEAAGRAYARAQTRQAPSGAVLRPGRPPARRALVDGARMARPAPDVRGPSGRGHSGPHGDLDRHRAQSRQAAAGEARGARSRRGRPDRPTAASRRMAAGDRPRDRGLDEIAFGPWTTVRPGTQTPV